MQQGLECVPSTERTIVSPEGCLKDRTVQGTGGCVRGEGAGNGTWDPLPSQLFDRKE